MNDDERTERLQLIELIAYGDGQRWFDFWRNPAQRQIAETMYGAQADEILGSHWLATYARRVAVAATRKEQEEIAIALDAEQATSNRSADSAGSRGSYERATQIGMVADAYGRAAALVRARGIAAVADVVDSQSHED